MGLVLFLPGFVSDSQTRRHFISLFQASMLENNAGSGRGFQLVLFIQKSRLFFCLLNSADLALRLKPLALELETFFVRKLHLRAFREFYFLIGADEALVTRNSEARIRIFVLDRLLYLGESSLLINQ